METADRSEPTDTPGATPIRIWLLAQLAHYPSPALRKYAASIPASISSRPAKWGVRSWHVDTELCRRYGDSIGRSCGVCQFVCPWNHSNALFHNAIRQLAQNVACLRSATINGERLFYKFKRRPDPEWLRTKALKQVRCAQDS